MEAAIVFEPQISQSMQETPNNIWETFINGINSFTDDCFEDGRPVSDDAASESRDDL